MNKAVYYKVIFITSGIYSIIAAAVFGLLAPFENGFMHLFGLDKADLSSDIIWMYCFLSLIGICGFTFILVGLDITKNHLVVSSGIIAKIVFIIILTVFFILGSVSWLVFIIAGIDLIWTGLFIEFYVNYKKLDRTDIVGAYPYQQTD